MNRINIRPWYMSHAQAIAMPVPCHLRQVFQQGFQQVLQIGLRIGITDPEQGIGRFRFGGCSGRPQNRQDDQAPAEPLPPHPQPKKPAASASPGPPPHNPLQRWHGHNHAGNSATHACRISMLRASKLSSGQSVCRCPQRLRPIVDHPPCGAAFKHVIVAHIVIDPATRPASGGHSK